MNNNNLWICFPLSKLQTSRNDPDQQGSILILHGETYNLGGRSVQLLKIPAVDIMANIQYIEILDIELSGMLEKLRTNLKLSTTEELFNEIRWPILVVQGSNRCSIIYSSSSITGDRNNILCLQSDVERCLKANLTQLDDLNQKPNWRENFIRPVINNAALKANIPTPLT